MIDASGVSGAAAKFLDMGGEVEVIAGFQYEILDVPNDGYLDFYLWPKYSPHGYVWMIPKEGAEPTSGSVTTDKKGAIKYLNPLSRTPTERQANGEPPWRRGHQNPTVWRNHPYFWPTKRYRGRRRGAGRRRSWFHVTLFEGGTHLACGRAERRPKRLRRR